MIGLAIEAIILGAVAVAYIILLIMELFIILLITLTTLTIGISGNIFFSVFSGTFGSILFPKYLKKSFEIINDKEAIKYIKKAYLQSKKPVTIHELLESILALIGIALSVYILFKGHYIVGSIAFFIIGYFSIFNLVMKFFYVTGMQIDTTRKQMIINFIYKVYEKYPNYAKEIYSFYLNFFKRHKMFPYSINKYERYIVNNAFPKSKREQIDMLFSALMYNFDEGIALIKKAKEQNIPVLFL